MQTRNDVAIKVVRLIKSEYYGKAFRMLLPEIQDGNLSENLSIYLTRKLFAAIRNEPEKAYMNSCFECFFLTFIHYEIDREQYPILHELILSEFERTLKDNLYQMVCSFDIMSLLGKMIRYFQYDINSSSTKPIIYIGENYFKSVIGLELPPRQNKCMESFLTAFITYLDFNECVDFTENMLLLSVDRYIDRDTLSSSLKSNPYINNNEKALFKQSLFRKRNYYILTGQN